MIFQLLYFLLTGLLASLFAFLPGSGDYPLLLPWGLDPIFVLVSSYWHGAMLTLPYLQVVWTCFLYAMGFELAMLFLKLFLGARTPHAR